ncbi:hypothetical protein V565_064580 [Rhizoctonia solani 123E]|uniref:Uncharacterized protein n=1 Tax=Rhizoctonia solani 123E TaxID=1423351 RepID=A0A074SML4_9AGAM|nr:hypothetical protein V565_064580 [Rhizoctonia solani 123E]
MSSDKDSPDAPVWCTGSDPIEVELVTSGKTYSVDTDIAKRMGIIQEGHKTESPFKLADCTDQDFERVRLRSISKPTTHMHVHRPSCFARKTARAQTHLRPNSHTLSKLCPSFPLSLPVNPHPTPSQPHSPTST